MVKARFHLLNMVMLVGCVLSILQANVCLAQQKAQFTQYMYDGLVLNPAFAGVNEALSLTFIHRNQWAGVDGAPNTQTLSAHTLFKNKQVGVGLSLSNDVIGVHKNLNVSANYAYHFSLSANHRLSFGLQTGIHNYRSDYASLLEVSGNDPMLYNDMISRTFFDFGVGAYFRGPKLHIGFSIPELMPQNVEIMDSLSIKLNEINNFLFTKYKIFVNENINVEPGLLMKYMHGVPLSFDLNMNLIFREVVTMGISYRKSESFDLLLKCQVTPQLQFGYSYDFPVGQVSNIANASHEIAVQYLFRFIQPDVASPR